MRARNRVGLAVAFWIVGGLAGCGPSEPRLPPVQVGGDAGGSGPVTKDTGAGPARTPSPRPNEK